jgi:UDP-N-acetylglucosamine--N-acetylmuramyl-(pentapeptide) pyrophosphoryl-undecaprenol N-acetylglucosamine transferase
MSSWVIAGGGTGGHVSLALALGEEIARRGEPVLFAGTDQGLEAKLVPQAGFSLVTLPARQVMGRGLLGSVLGAASLLVAAWPARRALADAQADIVISVGGYAAMPAILAAWLSRTPIALLEPNAIPGRVNRLAARFAQLIFVAFDRAADFMPRRAAETVGVPLRRGLLERFAAAGADSRRKPSSPFRLLVFGGSQGAKQINDAILSALPELARLPLEIFHQTGERDRARVAAAYEAAGIDAQIEPYEPDMPARYAWADVAVCRAGAITVAELALAGLPAILVPYPYAADDHQRANAAALEQAGAARCLDARPLDPEAVVETLCEWFAAPERLVAMSEAARTQSRPQAAKDVIDSCSELLAGSRAQ